MLQRTQGFRTIAAWPVLFLLSGCGNQNTVPLTVRLTYTSGNASGTVSDTDGLPTQHVAPNESINFEADGVSSLAGVKSVQIIPGESFTCQRGNIAGQGTPDFAPVINMPPPTSPVPMHLSVTFSFGPPSANCQEGFSLMEWNGSVTAIVIGLNGEQTESQSIELVSP